MSSHGGVCVVVAMVDVDVDTAQGIGYVLEGRESTSRYWFRSIPVRSCTVVMARSRATVGVGALIFCMP